MSKFAFVTLATNDSYSLGALVVANSLKKAQTQHQLAVLITPGVTAPMRLKLSSAFDVVQEVNVLDSKDAANLSLLARPELGVTFTKLHCWRLTQFEKCVFLDADTLILQNCDELFEREELSAAPDVGWPDCFNSGVFVYRPSLEQFAKLTAFAVKQGSFDGGDQGLLNLYFADWATKDIANRLPFVYNTCSTACYSYLPAFKQFGQGVKIMHFIGQLKPWLVNFDSVTRKAATPEGHGHLTKYLQLWWDIFCSEIHPKLSTDMNRTTDQRQSGNSPRWYENPEFQYVPPNHANNAHNKQTSHGSYQHSTDSFEHTQVTQPIYDPWEEYYERTNREQAQQTADNSHANYALPDACSGHEENPKPIYSHVGPTAQVLDHKTVSVDNQQPTEQRHLVNSSQTFHDSNTDQLAQVTHNVPYIHSESQEHHHHLPKHPTPTFQSATHTHLTIDTQPQPQSELPNREIHHPQQHEQQQQQHHHRQQRSLTETPVTNQSTDNYTRSQIDRLPQTSGCSVSKDDGQQHQQVNYTSEVESSSKQKDKEEGEKAQQVVPAEGGLAGALAQLTLGEPASSEQQAYEESMRQQCWESGNIDYLGKDSFDNIWKRISQTLAGDSSNSSATTTSTTSQATASDQKKEGTTNTLAKKTTTVQRNVAANVVAEQRRSSISTSTKVETSSTERRSSVTSTSSTSSQQQQQHQKETTSKKKQQQQKTAKSTASKKSTTATTEKSGIDVNQPIVIVPGHQKVEFDAATNTKTVTEKTTTGHQQTITTVSDEGLVKTQVKTFFDPVEIAGEETIEEEEETYEEVIETTEPTTRTTTSKTTTGQSDLVQQKIQDEKQSSTTNTTHQTQVVSPRKVPESTVTTRQIGQEEVRYETIVSEDGKTTTVRKIVTTPGEETEIVEYEEQEVTEPREMKVVTTTKTIPTLANIRSERSHSESVEVVEEHHSSKKTTSTQQQQQQVKQQKQQQTKKTKVDTHSTTETNVSKDGREVETIEYEEKRITEPAAPPKTKTTTKTTTVPASTKNTKTTSSELARRTEDTSVSQVATNAVCTTTLADGQEVQVETKLSADGKTKLLTKTIRQPEEDIEVEDYEETQTTVPRKVTKKSNNAVVSVHDTEEEQQNTIKTDKTRTRNNKMASETILVDAVSDRPIGQHQQVATSQERSNVTGVATTTVDAKRGAITSKVAASETNTKSVNQEEVTVLPNETKTSKKSETRTESRTITSSQTSSGGNVRQQRDSLTDTNLAAIKQKQQTIASVDKSVTAAVEDKSTQQSTKKVTQYELQQQQQQQQQVKQQQQNTAAKTDRSTSTTTTTSTTKSTQQQQLQQQQKSQMESQMKLTTKDKKFTTQVVSTTTDPKTGEVTTEEVRHFDGGREHIYTTVRTDGTMKMSSKTFFDAVPVQGSEEEEEETTTTTTTVGSAEELAKKKLQRAVFSKETAAADVRQPIPPPRKKEVKPVSQTTNK